MFLNKKGSTGWTWETIGKAILMILLLFLIIFLVYRSAEPAINEIKYDCERKGGMCLDTCGYDQLQSDWKCENQGFYCCVGDYTEEQAEYVHQMYAGEARLFNIASKEKRIKLIESSSTHVIIGVDGLSFEILTVDGKGEIGLVFQNTEPRTREATPTETPHTVITVDQNHPDTGRRRDGYAKLTIVNRLWQQPKTTKPFTVVLDETKLTNAKLVSGVITDVKKGVPVTLQFRASGDIGYCVADIVPVSGTIDPRPISQPLVVSSCENKDQAYTFTVPPDQTQQQYVLQIIGIKPEQEIGCSPEELSCRTNIKHQTAPKRYTINVVDTPVVDDRIACSELYPDKNYETGYYACTCGISCNTQSPNIADSSGKCEEGQDCCCRWVMGTGELQ